MSTRSNQIQLEKINESETLDIELELHKLQEKEEKERDKLLKAMQQVYKHPSMKLVDITEL